MGQFDISRNNSKTSKIDVPFVMEIQSNSVSILGSRIVVPLRKTENNLDKMISKIHVSIEVGNNEYIAFISEMAAIPSGMLGPTITNGASKRTEIISAIDLLFTGF
jgi:toxin CcdB